MSSFLHASLAASPVTSSCLLVHLARRRLWTGVVPSLPPSAVARRKRASSAVSSKILSPDLPPPLATDHVVVGCGLATMDYLGTFNIFPKPDDKILSTNLQVGGGGNAANAITCASRLGLRTRLISKVANDEHGRFVLGELESDGVDISGVVISETGNTPFSYVLIDTSTKTRTCLCTPGYPPLLPGDLAMSRLLTCLEAVSLVYFDGYSHKMSEFVAMQADQMKIPILVEAESEREKSELDGLLKVASYIVCSEKFPRAWTSQSSVAKSLLSILLEFPRAKFVVATLGNNGCMMLERNTYGYVLTEDTTDIEHVTKSLKMKLDNNSRLPTSVSSKNMNLFASGCGTILGRLHIGTAEKIPSPELVDTTGAGDAFIGALLYGLCAKMPMEKLLCFSSQVAAINCKAIGARGGRPRWSDQCLSSFLPLSAMPT